MGAAEGNFIVLVGSGDSIDAPGDGMSLVPGLAPGAGPDLPAAQQPPRYRAWLTVLLSIVVGLVAVSALRNPLRPKTTDGAKTDLLAVDDTLGKTFPGQLGHRPRSEALAHLRAIIDRLPPGALEEKLAGQVLLVIALIDDDLPQDAAVALGPFSGAPVANVLRCAFAGLGACTSGADAASADEALRAVGGVHSAASRRIREALAGVRGAPAVVARAGADTGLRDWIHRRGALVPRTVVLVLGLAIALIDRVRRRLVPKRPPASLPWTLWQLWAAGVRYVTAASVAVVVVVIALRVAHRPHPDNGPWIGLAASAFSLALVPWFFFRPWGLRLGPALGLRWTRADLAVWVRAALPAAAAAVALSMVIVLLEARVATPGSGLIEDQGIMATHGIARWVGTVLSVVILTPVLEEIEFRGLLFGTLRSRIGWVPAAIASSILFGLMHPYGPVGKVTAAVYGVILCCVYEKTGSVWAPIIAHVVVNLSATATFAFLAWEHSFS